MHRLIEGLYSGLRRTILRRQINHGYRWYFVAGGALGPVLRGPLLGLFFEQALTLALGVFLQVTLWVPLVWVRLLAYVGGLNGLRNTSSVILVRMPRKNRPHTPDGRYLVSKGVLKRCTDPSIDDTIRRRELKSLMQARMKNDSAAVLKAKETLGEAGAVWWTDGAPDVSGLAPADTDYADWWNSLTDVQRAAGLEARRRRD